MAKDKAVDSAVLNAGLTAIANAIREKTGGTDALAFPDGLAEAIAGIESGGAKMTYGTITPASDISGTTGLTIEHGLGVEPELFIFGVSPSVSGASDYLAQWIYTKTAKIYSPSDRHSVIIFGANLVRAPSGTQFTGSVSANSVTLAYTTNFSYGNIKATKHAWIAIG